MYSIIIIVNKNINYFSQFKIIKSFETLEDCQSELINFVVSHFKTLNIDFPDNLDDFNVIWFDNNRTEADSFTYMIIDYNNTHFYQWNEPWSIDFIYEKILESIQELDIKEVLKELEYDSNDD